MQVRCGIISSICCTLDRSVCLSENTARFTTTLNHPPHCGFPLGRRGVFNVLILGPLLLSCWGTLPLSNDCIFLKLLDIFLTLALSGVCTRRYCSSSPPPTSTSTTGPTCNEQQKKKKRCISVHTAVRTCTRRATYRDGRRVRLHSQVPAVFHRGVSVLDRLFCFEFEGGRDGFDSGQPFQFERRPGCRVMLEVVGMQKTIGVRCCTCFVHVLYMRCTCCLT